MSDKNKNPNQKPSKKSSGNNNTSPSTGIIKEHRGRDLQNTSSEKR